MNVVTQIFLRDLDSGKEDRPFPPNHFRESALDMGALFDAFSAIGRITTTPSSVMMNFRHVSALRA
jgi:hypothetical protein